MPDLEPAAESSLRRSPQGGELDRGDLAARLRISSTRLARRLRRESGVDLSPSMMSALTTVALHGPLTLGDLAELERVSPPTVTKVIGRLDELGLVVRETDEADRRVCRVRTSEQGDELLSASRARRTAWLADHLDGMDPEELEVLVRATDLIDRLLEADGGRA